MHWVPVLNHFDAFFEAHVAPRGEETLSSVSPLGAPFPAEPARWIVRASCVLLENCANKHVYGSCEHLGALLSCDDARVALDALRPLRRPRQSLLPRGADPVLRHAGREVASDQPEVHLVVGRRDGGARARGALVPEGEALRAS